MKLPSVPPLAAQPGQEREPTYTVTSRVHGCPDGQEFVTWEDENLLNFRRCSDGKTVLDGYGFL